MTDHEISRRRFAVAFVGGASALTIASADDKKAVDPATLSTVRPVELLLELIRRVDPEQLKREHLELLRGDLELNLQRSALLSAFTLTNADEPAPIFAAWRSEG